MEKVEFGKSKKTTRIKRKKLDRLYDKKPLIELVVAILSIPSLILLVLLNFNSLKNLNSKASPTPVPTAGIVIPGTSGSSASFFSEPISRPPRPTQIPYTSQVPCNKSLGPVSISSPIEGDTVSQNPVEIDISYNDGTYCSAVWSYSVNGSNWSDYNNSSVGLYNLPNGPVTFELRVKSLTSSNTTTLTRHFTYTGQSNAPLPTIASSSAH